MADNRDTKFDTIESFESIDTSNVHWEDEEMRQRVEQRRRASTSKKRRKRFFTLVIIIAAFALAGTQCGKDIVRLKAENRALKKQQIALEQQRDELQEELKNANNKEYIREQAKKQLRLLNPGEILFTFEEEEPSDEAEEAGKSGKSEKSERSNKDKAGDSNG